MKAKRKSSIPAHHKTAEWSMARVISAMSHKDKFDVDPMSPEEVYELMMLFPDMVDRCSKTFEKILGLDGSGTQKSARLSDCGDYRYELWRRWDSDDPVCVMIGLNPSTADAVTDDPTIRKCVKIAKREGCGSLCMINLFAYRTPRPKVLKKVSDPFGPENDETLERLLRGAGLVIAAWGKDGSWQGADQRVYGMIPYGRRIMCLGRNEDGSPKHPLYLKADTPLEEFCNPGLPTLRGKGRNHLNGHLSGEIHSRSYGVVGSRQFPDEEAVRAYVRTLPRHSTVVSGGCPDSPDEWAEEEALKLGMRVLSFRPVKSGNVWEIAVMDSHGETDYILTVCRSFGQAAYYRNGLIVKHSQEVVAFWDEKSSGTANTVGIAARMGVPVEVKTPRLKMKARRKR